MFSDVLSIRRGLLSVNIYFLNEYIYFFNKAIGVFCFSLFWKNKNIVILLWNKKKFLEKFAFNNKK